jgi:bacterioferritin
LIDRRSTAPGNGSLEISPMRSSLWHGRYNLMTAGSHPGMSFAFDSYGIAVTDRSEVPFEDLNMPEQPSSEKKLGRKELIAALNEDLAREYQAIIAYVVYSQVLKGAQYMTIAKELEKHAGEELQHAITISKQIDYLGGMPTATAKPVKLSENAEEMLRFDLQNESDTIRNYKERLRQCEALGEYAMAEHIREILVDEQEHQSDLATALGIDVPSVTSPEERA